MEALFYAIIMVQILRYLDRIHNGAKDLDGHLA